MARYTGPVCKLCRREGQKLFLKGQKCYTEKCPVERRPHYLKLLSSFTEDLPEDLTPQYILDLGCGNGNVTSRLLELFPKSNFVLLDASQEMINLCRMRFEGYTVEYITSYFNDRPKK